ncbi:MULTISPECIES: Dabb family protein [Caproicibacterium]|uniref:Dabb family protein n=1 Tax=Caproicibacterium argilliputei TaxID=3030016 RepID=A0AA97D9X4_9FIRM|nr:Dabb family protein [Caproicibacterium argilliputei]WOC33305.1 Dabb family protein [Caproicibacterium argilliputei]
MVRHIVLWKLNESQSKNAAGVAASLRSRFKALLGVVDGLTAIEVNAGYKAGAYDLCLIADFESKEAEAAYQQHPEHLKIKELVHTLISDRTAFDYEYAA